MNCQYHKYYIRGIKMNEELPNDFLSYLAGTKDAEVEKLFGFALDSLTFATKLQTFHWACESRLSAYTF